MDFLISAHSDIGIKKSTNQDSVLIQVANTNYGKVAFAVICDGMGGLAKGELASATLITAYAEWFTNDFPALLAEGFAENKLFYEWGTIVSETNKKITEYGNRNRLQLGTTLTALLLFEGRYYCINVGDSRTYRVNETLEQITKDQTYIQREMDMGRMTLEEAKKDPQRNVLLQCVGASNVVVPDYFSGEIMMNDVYMLCSDGFRHIITPEELYAYLNSGSALNEQEMNENLVYLTELNKYRHEDDNISVALIKVI